MHSCQRDKKVRIQYGERAKRPAGSSWRGKHKTPRKEQHGQLRAPQDGSGTLGSTGGLHLFLKDRIVRIFDLHIHLPRQAASR